MENEIWKPVVGFEGFYEVSNTGEVRSVDRVIKRGGKNTFLKGKKIAIYVMPNGYHAVALYAEKGRSNKYIHKIVAEAFLENPNNYPYVDHIDTDKENNNVDNLRWCSPSQNSNNPLTKKHLKESQTDEVRKRILATRRKNGGKTAEKTVYQFSKEGVPLNTFIGTRAAGLAVGVSSCNIIQACNDGCASGGYLWSYSKTGVRKYVSPWDKNKKKVYQYEKDGTFIREWPSVKDAKEALSITTISASIKHHFAAGGFLWSYSKVDKTV